MSAVQATTALGALRSRWAPVRARWAGLAARERLGLSSAAWLVALLLLWLVAVQPAWRSVKSAPTELARLETQWQAMRRQAQDAQTLRNAPGVSADAALQALQGATQRLGASGRLSLQGDRAVLTLTNADGNALRQWLTEARSGARARPLEASLTRDANGFSGTVIVGLGGRS